MKKYWPLAAALLLVAGCTAPASDPTTSPADTEPRYAFAPFTTPSDAPDGFGSEPSILVAQDGSIYFTTVLGSAEARGDGLFRSQDNGTTWEYLGKVDFPFGGGDSDIDQLYDGTLFVTGQWRPAAPPALPVIGAPYITGGESVYRSTDGGYTWDPFPVAGYLPYADRNWIAASGPIAARAVYLVYNSGQAGLMVGKSIDEGQTWLPPVNVQGTFSEDGVNSGPNGIAGDPVIDVDGTLFIPYGPGPGGGTVQRIYSSADQGVTFQEHVVRVTPQGETAGAIFSTIAVDDWGDLYLTWAETENGTMRAWLSMSSDEAATWSEPIAVSPPGMSIAFPWVTAGGLPPPDPSMNLTTRFGQGLAVAFYAANGSFVPDEAPDNATWVPMVSFSQNPCFGRFETVAVTTTPNHIGPICTSGTGCSGGRELGDFFEIDIDQWGHVVIVYADDTGEARTNHVAVQTVGPSLL